MHTCTSALQPGHSKQHPQQATMPFPIADLPVELQEAILLSHTAFPDRLSLAQTSRGMRCMMPRPKSALHVLKDRTQPLASAATTATDDLAKSGHLALIASNKGGGNTFYDAMDRTIDMFVTMAKAVSDELAPLGIRFDKLTRTYTVHVDSMERATRAEVCLVIRDETDGFEDQLVLVVEGGR